MLESLPLSGSITPTCFQERRKMDRLEAFEKMLSDITEQSEYENAKMQELKAQGKEKTATYRQFMGNKFMFGKILELYRKYGLIK